MDLFYQGTMQEQIKSLKKDIRAKAKKEDIKFKHKLSLVWGVPAHLGNNMLVVQPPYNGGIYFQDPVTCQTRAILDEHGIKKYFLTHCYHIPKEKVTTKDIKSYSTWVQKIVYAVEPKMILCLGEESMFSFFKRKMVLRDHHGKIVGYHEDIPVMLTFPVSYYREKSTFEDNIYKRFMLERDWAAIKKEYEKVVT